MSLLLREAARALALALERSRELYVAAPQLPPVPGGFRFGEQPAPWAPR